MYYLSLVLAGIATGAIYSLAGMGVVLTYKATGIFNFAHGAIAVLAAYTYWYLGADANHGGRGVPVGIAAFISIFVLGPVLGALLEFAVFRPLQRSGASTVEKLVATVGTFVLMLGIVVAVWHGEVRQVPALFSHRTLHITKDLSIGVDQTMTIVVVAVVCAAVWALFRFTHLGTEIRAVVDRRELAELSGIDADRIAGIAWMMGVTMSALTGVLLSSQIVTLNSYDLALLVIETFSIAVVARLTSLPIAVAAGVAILGVGNSLLNAQSVNLFSGRGVGGETFANIKPHLSVIVLFAALLIYRRLDTVGEETAIVRRTGGGWRPSARLSLAFGAAVGAALVVLPGFLSLSSFDYAQRFLAMIVIFASIVAVTGFSGQITLGQAGFAGLGGFAAARFTNAFGLPVVVGILCGGLVAMAAGFLAGYPALRRRGLFLGLTTLSIGLLLDRFVFENTQFTGGVNGLQVQRPSLFGLSLNGDRAFYYFELAVVAVVLLFVRNLRSGRLGRALAAMRDSEPGSRSVGVDLRTYKLFIFAVSSFLAGVGGALLTEQARAFQFSQFNPLFSLFWFAAVVVAGAASVFGAVLAGFLFVMLDVILHNDGASQGVIGLAALTLGVLPGGSVIGLVHHLGDRLSSNWEAYRTAAAERAEAASSRPAMELTPYARELLGRDT